MACPGSACPAGARRICGYPWHQLTRAWPWFLLTWPPGTPRARGGRPRLPAARGRRNTCRDHRSNGRGRTRVTQRRRTARRSRYRGRRRGRHQPDLLFRARPACMRTPVTQPWILEASFPTSGPPADHRAERASPHPRLPGHHPWCACPLPGSDWIGQSTGLADAHALHGIDADAIVSAALDVSTGRGTDSPGRHRGRQSPKPIQPRSRRRGPAATGATRWSGWDARIQLMQRPGHAPD